MSKKENEKNVVSVTFGEATDLVAFSAKHDAAVEYLLDKKDKRGFVEKSDLLNILGWSQKNRWDVCVEVPLLTTTLTELLARRERVYMARRYLKHGTEGNGAYIDPNAFYCIFGIEPEKTPVDTDF